MPTQTQPPEGGKEAQLIWEGNLLCTAPKKRLKVTGRLISPEEMAAETLGIHLRIYIIIGILFMLSLLIIKNL